MKTFTTVEQSKRLLELGVKPETADMTWIVFVDNSTRLMVADDWMIEKMIEGGAQLVPCWSLGALFAIMQQVEYNYPNLTKHPDTHEFFLVTSKYCTDFYDNPIDACMDMIEWGMKKWFNFK